MSILHKQNGRQVYATVDACIRPLAYTFVAFIGISTVPPFNSVFAEELLTFITSMFLFVFGILAMMTTISRNYQMELVTASFSLAGLIPVLFSSITYNSTIAFSALALISFVGLRINHLSYLMEKTRLNS